METMTSQFIQRHLENAIAAEQNLEDIFSRLSDEGEQEDVKQLLLDLSKKARTQHQRLTARLKELGGSPSTLKSIAAHLIGFSPLAAQGGETPQEKNTQHLILVYAAVVSGIAVCEALATISRIAGDTATERLARELQDEDKADCELVWNLLGSSASRAFDQASTQE